MPATTRRTTTKQKSISQRSSDALHRLQALIDTEDTKVLGAAIAEVAAIEAEQNLQFRDRVAATYNELSALKVSASSRKPFKPLDNIELTPLPGTEGIHIDPFGGLDPYLLLRLYGPHQLRKALTGFSFSALKEAVSVVKLRNPNSKPTNARSADSMLNYIVEQLAPGN